MQDDDEYIDEDQKAWKKRNNREQQLFKRAFANAASRNGSGKLAIHDGDSSSDAEWRQWTDSPTRRRKPAGLLSQTIHEEDDD